MDKSKQLLFITIGFIVGSFVVVTVFCGFSHEQPKLKIFVLTIFFVWFLHQFVLDLLKFLLRASFTVWRKRQRPAHSYAHQHDRHYTRSDGLHLRIESLKSQLQLLDSKQNEKLNSHYKRIEEEMWLFLRSFAILLLLIVGSRDPLAYYNTSTVESLLDESFFSGFGLKSVSTREDFLHFINVTLIEAFNRGIDVNGRVIEESGWINFRVAKLLGVVRIRQLRQVSKKIGLNEPIYTNESYLPNWVSPFPKLHYVHKYWRVYQPWLPIQHSYHFLFSSMDTGKLRTYPPDIGYEAFLARDVVNSQDIMDFLTKHSWFDDHTTALIVDFTLYSIDSEIFSMCRIIVEATPFGTILVHRNVESAELRTNISTVGWFGWLIVLLHILQLSKFMQRTCLNAWLEPAIMRSIWFQFDVLIILLDLTMIMIIIYRDRVVMERLQRLAESDKADFVDFTFPNYIENMLKFTAGLLIATTTVRIWKILQFTRTIRLFTTTLYNASKDMLGYVFLTTIFIMGFSICIFMVNGTLSDNFSLFVNCLTLTITFTLGNRLVRPEELNNGGALLGFILYFILIVVMAILMINMFITLIINHYYHTKRELQEEYGEGGQQTFFQFLLAEHAHYWHKLRRILPMERQRKPRHLTVTQHIDRMIEMEEKSAVYGGLIKDPQLHSIERLHLISNILRMQTELLRQKLSTHQKGNPHSNPSNYPESKQQV